MNRQRKIVITITYNEIGIIIDTKAEELDLSAQPEIVRCKDCGHWDTTWQNDFAPNYHYCSLVDGTRRGDFFCADAERRGEQNEIDNCYQSD